MDVPVFCISLCLLLVGVVILYNSLRCLHYCLVQFNSLYCVGTVIALLMDSCVHYFTVHLMPYGQLKCLSFFLSEHVYWGAPGGDIENYFREFPVKVCCTTHAVVIKKYSSSSQLGTEQLQNGRLYIRCRSSSMNNKANKCKKLINYIPWLFYC